MTRDEIIKGMGWPALAGQDHIPDAADDLICRIKSIVHAAEQAEREAIKAIIREHDCKDGVLATDDVLAAIRARGDQP